ncbi:MAG: molybdopterin-binding protein [Pseudolabrys sp.]
MGATVKRVKMAAMPETNQTIARLTPLAVVLSAVDAAAKPVAAREVEFAAVRGRVLAADVVAAKALPAAAVALQDGWAVNAEATRDAGGYAPMVLAQAPSRIEAGQPMPKGTDAVAPFETIQTRGEHAEAVAAVVPGDGVLAAGGDCAAGTILRKAGARVRDSDGAVFAAGGIAHVSVREPRLSVVPSREDSIIDAAAHFIANDVKRQAGVAHMADGDLDRALRDESVDAIIVIGGTGSGRNDKSVQALARAGRVAVHGIALTPGETAAFGTAGSRPVLLVPGRLDATFAVWLTLGRHMLARLSGSTEKEQSTQATLSRKITSTVSLTEFVPVRRDGDKVEPLATKYLSLAALAQAGGFVLVPAESEGFQAGSSVFVRPWP